MNGSSWSLALRTLRRYPGRTLLMGLGLAVGAASITITLATGQGARRKVEDRLRVMIGELDVLLIVQGGPADRGTSHLESSVTTLVADDATAIASSVPDVRAVTAEQIELGAVVEANGKNSTASVTGATANWAMVRGDSLASGSLFTDADGASLARVGVIGSDVAKEFFPDGNAVGQRIRVRGVDFDVVGVLTPRGGATNPLSAMFFNVDYVIYVPLATAQRRLLNREHLNMIRVKLDPKARWTETQAAVEAILRERHAIRPNEADDFRVMSPEGIIARSAGVTTPLRRAVLWVGALALLIGGIVIANLMFAAAVARSREIGTQRAIGASRRDVLRQFWAEAVVVAAVAALTGTLVAATWAIVGTGMFGKAMVLEWPTTLATILAAVGIGALAGYFPARRAATVPPAVALRHAE
jgi:ABC-type antimicrobial peptide transport system permease subunit